MTWETAEGTTLGERAASWVLGNRLRSVVSLWGVSMCGLMAWQMRKPTAMTLKLIESRVYAQFLTVGAVVGLVAAESMLPPPAAPEPSAGSFGAGAPREGD